jgi:hypothetical protein
LTGSTSVSRNRVDSTIFDRQEMPGHHLEWNQVRRRLPGLLALSFALLGRPTLGDTLFNANEPGTTYHSFGAPVGVSAWSATARLGPGFLTYGPYSSKFQNGVFRAGYKLSVDNNSADDLVIAYIDVYDSMSNKELARREIHRKEFNARLSPQEFQLSFTTLGANKLEFRVYVFGNSYVEHQSTMLTQESTVPPASALFYEANDPALGHSIGYAKGMAWVAGATNGSGNMTTGPNTAIVPAGIITATFSLSIDDNHKDDAVVARIDSYDGKTAELLGRRIIKRMDFVGSSAAQDFDVVFEVNSSTTPRFRIFVFGRAEIQHNSVTIRPDRLNLAALWDRQAHFEFRKRDSFTFNGRQDSSTSSLMSLDGVWYAFNRTAANLGEKQISTCLKANRFPVMVVVRASSDRGITWSDPNVVATPSASPSAPDYCGIVDGAAFFDTETDTWHYLGQCLNEKSPWNLCHYTRPGLSPLGTFSAGPANPVVSAGQLWKQICSGTAKACPETMIDEGTPQIIGKSNQGYFYVTFHGANYGALVTGARGAARTRDFVHWEVAADDLPGNAMLSAADCNGWNVRWASGGCIGAGAARIIRSNGLYYMLTEAADHSLGCVAGQVWVFGLLRSPTLAASGGWQNYDSNPFISDENVSPGGCALQYMNFVRDRGELFLEFSLYTPDYPFPNYTYQLVDGPPSSNAMQVK